jgi:hypothetical protein
MDEVRLWSVARSQSDILRTMRWAAGLEKEPGLVGWWKFDEPSRWCDHMLAAVFLKLQQKLQQPRCMVLCT